MSRCRRLFVWVLAFSCIQSGTATACPAFLSVSDVLPQKRQAFRQSLAVFAWKKGVTGNYAWQGLPLQIDPMDERGVLEFFPPDVRWETKEAQANDRLSFYTEEFGERFPGGFELPCLASGIREVRTRTLPPKYAYVADCGQPVSGLPQIGAPPIAHDAKFHRVKSDTYEYRYMPKNHLMFDEIAVFLPEDQTRISPATESLLSIRGDVKKFFTMNFDKDDVESTLRHTRQGPLALVGILSFYLRILFFRIDMNLETEVSFFRDGVYVPMVMNMPIDSREKLHAGSGLIFSWLNPGGESRYLTGPGVFPEVDASLVKAGAAAMAAAGKPFCSYRDCTYILRGVRGRVHWALKFVVPRTLADYGFFPSYVPSTRTAKVELGWDKKPTDETERVGVYFEVSGLPAGEHHYDFWILLGIDSPPAVECPVPLRTGKFIEANGSSGALPRLRRRQER